MTPSKSALAACALLAMAGCASTQTATTRVEAAAQAVVTPTLSTNDAAFFDLASRGGIEEVTFGQLARDQGSRSAVKTFATRMVDEHTTTNQELTKLAALKGITPPATMDGAHTTQFNQIAALKGRAFDRAYLDGQATDHAATLKVFQDEAQNGADPDVKAFAAKTAPAIQTHLDMVRKLGGRLMTPATS